MSNGKKLGVKSKVSDNYLVTGNDYEKFQEALHDMDNRTVIIALVILSVFRIAWECLMVMEYQRVSAHHRMLDNRRVRISA